MPLKDRYCFVKSKDKLEPYYKNIVQVALEQASQSGRNLRVCVPVKASCEEYLTKAFDEPTFRILHSKKQILVSGVKVGLFSTQTLRKEHILLDAIYLVFSPTADLLHAIESHGRRATVIVFSEADKEGQTISNWVNRYQPKPLRLRQKKTTSV
ncbi:hypothetical protein [Pantoea cypripedii]|uniref:Uncharacterized protein n=1 Tax=Pantoea cypripedii TaxID=55209 RepID=A0A6B9G624_PANCY|nr:hypothetical protein [Pantoea cypripedii]QGY33014.1 hypothetical protein CUN67_29230 [Pantoea cypripedii]